VSVDVRATLNEVARTPIGPDAIARVSARISGALAISAIGLTGLLLLRVDLLLKFDTILTAGEPYRHWPALANFAHFLDNAGQRGLMVPLLLAFTAFVVYRTRSWRPVVVTATSLLVINIVVGAMKYITARPSPRLGPAPLLDHGVIGSVGLFPSGHAANAVLIWGIAVYLGAVGLGWSARTVKRGAWTVAIVTAIVSVCSLFQQFHWPTDLIAGVLIGGAVLGATIAADRWRPGWYEPLDKSTRVAWEQRRRYREGVEL
jgi:undecaprenyl-diphosphatase